MHLTGSPSSWSIELERWPQQLESALWIRDVEHIEVPANPIVPGPVDLDPLPRASGISPSARLGAQWLAWWTAILAAPHRQPFDPPDFPGLDQWPELQRIVRSRAQEAFQWSTLRKQIGTRGGPPRDMRINEIVSALEAQLGRPLANFSLTLVILPVLDDEVRDLGHDRYIIPERIWLSPALPEILRSLILPRA